MSPLDSGSRPQGLGRASGSQANHKPEKRQPPGSQGGLARPDVTIDYAPKETPVPQGAVRAESPSPPRHYDFLDPPRADNQLGHLGHYRVLKLIGEGGMGLVFLAEDTDLSRPVAIKVIKPEQAASPGVCERFLREARATAAIKHDHIVTIYHVGREREVPYLAMEYLQGVSLARWVGQGRRLTTGQVLRIGREVALGLAAAHRIGLVHRDVKPANIWLEAPSGRVKILDFGLARSQHNDVALTQSGTIVGTPEFMSPEQARGEVTGPESDLFSLGCVLYRLCAGEQPFPGTTIMAVLTALSLDIPRPLRELDAGVPPALDDLVKRLLAKHPGDRPASAEAVVEAIKAIERDLWAVRQRPELTSATPRAVDPHALNQGKPDAAQSPGDRRLTIRSGAGRLTRLIVPAVLIIVAVVGGFVTALGHKNTPRATASEANSEALLATGNEGPTTTKGMEGPRHALTEARPDHLGPRDDQDALPKATSPQSAAAPPIGSSKRTPARSASLDPPGPASSKSSGELAPRKDRPDEMITEKKVSHEGHLHEVSVKHEWGGPIDPDGDCKIDQDQSGNKITIAVPGTPHLLSAELGRMNAPRLLRNVQGDFDALVKVSGVFHPSGKTTAKEYDPYHGAGILLWQDEDNYVRLEIAADVQHGKSRPYVNFEYRKDGALAASRGRKIGDSSSHLRMARRGDEIHAAFGPDGVHWTSFPALTSKLKDRLLVGVSAINTATKPLTAELVGFELLDGPRPDVNADAPLINP